MLVKNDVPPERTGNFVTKYDKSGKPVQLEEVKVGKSTYLQDKNGNIRSGFDFATDPSEVRGSPEYRTRVKQATGNIESQLKEMRDSFDIYDKEKGDASTDIETRGQEADQRMTAPEKDSIANTLKETSGISSIRKS